MKLISALSHMRRKNKLQKLRKSGMTFSDDLSLMSMPDFGSEPYLISIGSHVRICSGVKFITHDGSTWVFRDQNPYQYVVRFGKISIGDNCFIGENVLILPNVKIGSGCIIGAGSVVTRDVPDGMVAAGVPAKTITSVQAFADKCLDELPEYDHEEYHRKQRYWKTRLADLRREKGNRHE